MKQFLKNHLPWVVITIIKYNNNGTNYGQDVNYVIPDTY